MENIFLNRRKHKRISVPDDTVVACNSEIGRMTNISQGGMGVNFILDKPFNGGSVVTLISRSNNLHIKELPVCVIHKTEVPFTRMSWYKVQPVGLKFDFANAEQKAKVRKYISTLSKGSDFHQVDSEFNR